jgi:hypothetical protein
MVNLTRKILPGIAGMIPVRHSQVNGGFKRVAAVGKEVAVMAPPFNLGVLDSPTLLDSNGPATVYKFIQRHVAAVVAKAGTFSVLGVSSVT